jgi:hypothetical protein
MMATTQARPDGVDDFFAKDIPEPYQILGLQLLPMSIGRYRRMARHKIAFVDEGKKGATGKDLLLGVLICSMTCRGWDALSVSNKLPKVIAQWMRKIGAAPPFYLRFDPHGQGRWNLFKGIVSASFIGELWRVLI